MPPTVHSLDEALAEDERDQLARFRNEFHLPRIDGRPQVYLVGNSLGLQPRRTAVFVQAELDKWRDLAAEAHFAGDHPWMPYHEFLSQPMADIVGALPEEVVVMNSLTVNLHLMMATFYQPTKHRNEVLIEQGAFPSDHFAVESHISHRGYDPAKALILLRPDPATGLLGLDDVCEAIDKRRDTLALVMLPGVHYFTGQWLDIAAITQAAHAHGIAVGMDLAHAAGNVPLQLHDWNVDFAVWCTYKYLNSGPGSLGGCFVHQRHAQNTSLNRLAGWWGHDKQTRFQMRNEFHPIATAEGWQLSNPAILSMAAIRASLEVFAEAGGMQPLREKSLQLTGYLEKLLESQLGDRVTILSPRVAERRGCQLSLVVNSNRGRQLTSDLADAGVLTDWREPNVVRAAPVPLYNTFEEVFRFVEILKITLLH